MINNESFYVYKKCDNNRSIVGSINNRNKYLKFVELDIKKMDNIKNYQYVDENNINNIKNQIGIFLFDDHKYKTKLVRQYATIEKGLCFDNIIINKQLIASWTLLEDKYNKILSNKVNYVNKLKMFNVGDINGNVGGDNNNSNILIIDNGKNKNQLIQDIIGTIFKKHEFDNKLNPNCHLFSELDLDKINDILEIQVVSGCKNKIHIILDNCIPDIKDALNNKQFMKLFQNGKYYNITLIICMKFPVPVYEFNSRIDCVILYENTNGSIREKMYEHYAKFMDSFDEFNIIFNKNVVFDNALVIFNHTNNMSLYVPNI